MTKTPPLALPISNTKSFKCPHCYCYSTMQYKEVHFTDDPSTIEDGNKRYKTGVIVARCDNCEGKIIWNDGPYVYPNMSPEEANEDMPESVLTNKSPTPTCLRLQIVTSRFRPHLKLQIVTSRQRIHKRKADIQ